MLTEQRAFLNITPRSNNHNQSTILRFLFQNGRDLELYVQDFLNCCGWAAGDGLTLMEIFLYVLDDSIRVVMPMADPSWDLESYINFALRIVGSAFTVCEVAGDLRSSPIITTDHQTSHKVAVIPEPCTVSIPAYTNITKPYPTPIPVPVLTGGEVTDCPVDETVSPTSPTTAATASNHITSISTFPRAMKVVSNSADLVAKLADPPIISVRKTIK